MTITFGGVVFSGGGFNVASAPSVPTGNGSMWLKSSSVQYLKAPANAAFAVGTNQFCVEGFIYISSVTTSVLVSTRPGQYGSFSDGWTIQWDANGSIRVNVGGSFNYVLNATNALVKGGWYHIAMCRNASNVTSLFVNGVRLSTSTTITNNFSRNLLAIGNYPTSQDPTMNFDGYLSNFRIVNGSSVYDPTQTTLTVPTTNLTAISGTSILLNTYSGVDPILDSSPNNFTLTSPNSVSSSTTNPFDVLAVMRLDASTLSANPTTWRDSVNGLVFTLTGSPTYSSANGGKLTFNGTSQYAKSTAPSFNVLQRWSTEVWINNQTANPAQYRAVVTDTTGSSGAINFTLGTPQSATGLQSAFYTNSVSWVYSSATPPAPAALPLSLGWQHWVGTYDGTYLSFYINGSLVVSTNVGGKAQNSDANGIALMKRWDQNAFWGGALSIVNIYNGALSTAQVLDNYNANKTRFGLS